MTRAEAAAAWAAYAAECEEMARMNDARGPGYDAGGPRRYLAAEARKAADRLGSGPAPEGGGRA